MVKAFAGLTRFCHLVDNIIIYDSDEHQHAIHIHVQQFLHCGVDKHITRKCKISQTKIITLAEFILSAQGYRVDRSITDVISQFPARPEELIYLINNHDYWRNNQFLTVIMMPII